ncbi:MAG: hypothetical protein Q4C98_08340 [Capnocytophaga sp.]|nr:hypothetical protein [Capnocytophaga sp.]
MKNLKNVILTVLVVITTISCKKDDTPIPQETKKGKVVLEFLNNYQDGALALNEQVTTPPPMEQRITISQFSYIISDISLINSSGEEVKYHHTDPNKGAFLILQNGTQTPQQITLSDIAVGDYTAIKFRIGVSNEAKNLGQNKQTTFWNAATATDMAWSWEEGYKHFNYEGTWIKITDTATETKTFSMQLGSTQTVDNSIVLTLKFPTNSPTLALTDNATKNVRIEVNANTAWGGKNKIEITDENANIREAGDEILSKIIENLSTNTFKAASVY